MSEVKCPEEWVLELESVFVIGGKFIILPDGNWLDASIIDLSQNEMHKDIYLEMIESRKFRVIENSSVPSVIFAKEGSDNFGHVLVEILPKLINLSLYKKGCYRLIIPQSMEKFVEIIQLVSMPLGISFDIFFVDSAQALKVENAIFLGPVSEHNIRKSETLKVMRNLMMGELGIIAEPKRKIYVERRASEQRSLLNTEEVREFFIKQGYEVIHPGPLTLIDQIRLFSQASHIVGTIGAGMTNIMFADRACKVTMIDNGLADYFFWDLASLFEQTFTWAFSQPISFFSQELATSSYYVDLNLLRLLKNQEFI